MQTLYKVTDHNNLTKNNTQWGPNVTNKATGKGQTLCTDGFIHAYVSPYHALILKNNHVNFPRPVLWVAEGKVVINDNNIKVGCKELTTLYTIPFPEIKYKQFLYFAALSVQQLSDDPKFLKVINTVFEKIDTLPENTNDIENVLSRVSSLTHSIMSLNELCIDTDNFRWLCYDNFLSLLDILYVEFGTRFKHKDLSDVMYNLKQYDLEATFKKAISYKGEKNES